MRIAKFLRKYIPISLVISLSVLLVFAILALIAPHSAPLSDFVNSYIATPIRVLMCYVTYLLPFSLFEILLILIIPAIALVIILIVRDKRGAAARVRSILALVSAVAIIYSGYLAVMAIPYHTTTLAEKLGIDDTASVDPDDLYDTAVYVRDQANFFAELVKREGDVAVYDGSYLNMSTQISDGYAALREKYPVFFNFRTRAKPIIFSGIMSDMGIAGIYTYFTGEANINTLYPDYSTVFTAAHELAHQRGINREEEANFMAFLATSSSTDPFLQYSAYLNMYEYLASAVYSTDKERYSELNSGLSSLAAADINAAREVTLAHRESFLYDLMHNVNDSYLKSNGTDGVVSYGYVVRIAVAYYNKTA